MRTPKHYAIGEKVIEECHHRFNDLFLLEVIAVFTIEVVFRKVAVGEVASHKGEFVPIIVDFHIANFRMHRGEDCAGIWWYAQPQTTMGEVFLK
jgi:hypothetical protein